MGDGPEKRCVMSLAKESESEKRVSFQPPQGRSHVFAAMAASKIRDHSVAVRTVRMVALEACQREAIVASRVGGLPEFLAGADALLV